jgi:hypothetical protein
MPVPIIAWIVGGVVSITAILVAASDPEPAEPKNCDNCGDTFRGNNCADKFRELQKTTAYIGECESCARLCESCWFDLKYAPCKLCGEAFDCEQKKTNTLVQNLAEYGVSDLELSFSDLICPDCMSRNIRRKCSQCETVMLRQDNKADQYAKEGLRGALAPYGKNQYRDTEYLCAACYSTAEAEYSALTKIDWQGDTSHEYLHGFNTTNKLGIVEYNGHDCSDRNQLEATLRRYATQLGANAFIRFYWDRHHENNTQRYIEGYGPNGNPYFGTERYSETWYTGTAHAVIVKPRRPPKS